MAKDEKSLVNRTETSVVGSFLPADFEALIGDGFASIDTVMLGHPEDGKLPFYIGKLVGPGAPVKMSDTENEQPTWAFHPVTRLKDGKLGIAENVTHIVPASYMVHAACQRIFDQCERTGRTAMVGVMFVGQGKTKKGRALNQYRIFEKYDATPTRS
jgi:hypothetical protein